MLELQAAGLVVGDGRQPRASEDYRLLSTQMLRSRAAPHSSRPGNLVMVTSAKPGEGRSFTAINLAASLVQHSLIQHSLAQHSQTKTLLIDTDPGRGSLTARLGLAGRPGLFDLAGAAAPDAEAALVNTAVGGLRLLPAGAAADGTAREMAVVLGRLAGLFPDHVLILDAPPCLGTGNPGMLASSVSQVVMVVEAARTSRRHVEEALAVVRACPSIVLSLNKARFR